VWHCIAAAAMIVYVTTTSKISDETSGSGMIAGSHSYVITINNDDNNRDHEESHWHGMSQFQIPMLIHIIDTATMAGAAADKAASTKETKYRQLANSHVFIPVAIETAGTWNHLAVELTQELGRRITAITDDPRETSFSFQRLSVALQRGNVKMILLLSSSLLLFLLTRRVSVVLSS